MSWAARCYLPVLILSIVFGSGCSPTPEEEVPADLLSAMDSFYHAIQAGDTEAWIELFSDDAMMMPDHGAARQGKTSIAELIREGGGTEFRMRDHEIVDMDVSGHIAYTVNSYYYTNHASAEAPQWHKAKNVHVWKRDAAGDWKLHVDIWNSDVPMEQFADE